MYKSKAINYVALLIDSSKYIFRILLTSSSNLITSLLPPVEQPQPHVKPSCTYYPNRKKNGCLNRCKHRASNHHEPADSCEDNGYNDPRLHRARKMWFAEAQDDSAQHGKEEESVLSKAIEREQDAHVSEQDVDGREDSVQDQSVDGRFSFLHGIFGSFVVFSCFCDFEGAYLANSTEEAWYPVMVRCSHGHSAGYEGVSER
jgi:hypothetical protein